DRLLDHARGGQRSRHPRAQRCERRGQGVRRHDRDRRLKIVAEGGAGSSGSAMRAASAGTMTTCWWSVLKRCQCAEMTLYLGYNAGDQFDGAVVIFAGQD